MFRIWFTNFGYHAHDEFTTLEAAVDGAKRHCFEAQIIECGMQFRDGGEVVATWSPIGGLRRRPEERAWNDMRGEHPGDEEDNGGV